MPLTLTGGARMGPLISVEDLRIGFVQGKALRAAVDGVSLCIAPGETLGLVGESGSGKSLTARAILGLTPPGAVQMAGRVMWQPPSAQPMDIARLPPNGPAIRALRGNRIAMIFQEPMASLSPVHTIGAQVATILRQHSDLRPRAIAEKVVDLLGSVGLPRPSQIARSYPHEVSGGMRQRAMIAMAISCDPDLLICDEPTTALDATTETLIMALLQDLQARRHMAMLFISHNIALVGQVADRVVVMKDGGIVEQGRTAQVLETPTQGYTRMLLDAVPRLDGQSATPRPEPERRAPLVRIAGLTKTFKGRSGFLQSAQPVQALAGIDLDIYPGETLALVGESGSGKSTLARCLMAAMPATSGVIEMRGAVGSRDVTALRGAARKAHWREVQMVFQDPFTSLNPRMTVLQCLAEPLRNFGIAVGRDAQTRVATMLGRVGLDPDMMYRYPHAFSGGQRQRICIARALIVEPVLVVGDEPVSALDVAVAAQIVDLFHRLKQDLGLTYLLITHDLAMVQKTADRVAVMHGGRLVEVGQTDRVFANPQADYTRQLLDAVPRLPARSLEVTG